jgi:DNA-binding CsgD family transcriptional regulator
MNPVDVDEAVEASLNPGSLNKRQIPAIKNRWNLSPMEFAVLERYAYGLQGKQVADSFALSVKTTNTHLMRAREKMGHVSTVRACVMLDRFMREGMPPSFKVMIEMEDGKFSTSFVDQWKTELGYREQPDEQQPEQQQFNNEVR